MTGRRTRTGRAACLVAGLAVGLAACGSGGVSTARAASGAGTPASDQPAAAPTTAEAGLGTTAAPAAGTGAGPWELGDLPAIVIPDVSTFTDGSHTLAESLGADTGGPISGLLVTGARCDAKGRVINKPGLTAADNGDGSGTSAGGDKTVTNNGDGSGTVTDVDKAITNNGDGSGTYVADGVTIAINRDGSGTYVDNGKTVAVNGDGSGTYTDAGTTLAINRDGSGTWTGPDVTVAVEADGSGTYNGPRGVVTADGTGTGTIDGVPGKVASFPRFAPVGKFPPVDAIKPLGRSCGTLIRLDARVLFDFDSADLRPEAGPVLDQVAGALKGSAGPLQVNGHTDAKGTDAYNQDLSERRARTVADALRGRGVTAALEPTGYGEAQPIAPNELNGKDNPAGRQQNRRVEIVIPG